ncbi:bifunctional 3-(3-hydroxy-phenyl)propionate/3-hydroxycinnamic acid hydroxylase [Mesorhizobium sp. CO1-1-9]|uniref:bifunctional 3-(3-hydroxy-phenyl)propionate/3-hydroxycinnamic acid hydroxylase n=1 Tax=Mesorhizobium sp. CO1-1-9 TaxID=2876630 RepID=UPI001CCA55A9|nr:bifunctional 3-(3-hydroxy-phenyl)propionate/3-hydroxycinnamic acid hydroxylase [Mesorhizobium sp. CO1-1-9]MBZ9694949.1 bifunctional 3-(3-hydroxy-phenyl)propionate/3-hydroxycinnamic acid hydroxylase [Mesorhizobium sp. CO1-1-9]
MGYPKRISVVIAGAGPTGLTTANLLASYGVDCVVLEREAAPLNLPRAIVLDDEGMRTLQAFGLHDSYAKKSLPAVGARYIADDGTVFAETGAGSEDYGFPKRQYIYQPELEDALRTRLEEKAPGTLQFSSEVVSFENHLHGVTVKARHANGQTYTIEAQWLLACDGGRSPIREALNITMVGNTYSQDWIVLDTIGDADTSRFSKFFCSNTRPMVSIPAPNTGRRYEFMLLPGESREQVLQPDFLASLLKPHRPYDEAQILRKTVYTFHARMAEKLLDRRVILMGDAAHMTPPFAGQGMNAGLRDAHNIAWKVAATILGGADAKILDSYESERRKPAWDMIQLAVVMGDFVMPLSAEQIAFRNQLLTALQPFPAVRDYLVQMRFKPKPRHGGGLYIDLDRPEFDASLVGEMIPQPELDIDGKKLRLDDMLGDGFALIAQDKNGAEALEALPFNGFAGLSLAKVFLPMEAVKKARPFSAARPYRTHRDQILLVRPDRYCAAAFWPQHLEDGLDAYRTLLGSSNPDSSSEISSAVEMRASL